MFSPFGVPKFKALVVALLVSLMFGAVLALGSTNSQAAGARPASKKPGHGSAPVLSLSPSTASDGVEVTVTGNGFPRGSAITIALDTTSVLSGKTNGAGTFQGTFIIAQSVGPGQHTVVGTSNGQTASAPLTIVAPSPTQTPTVASPTATAVSTSTPVSSSTPTSTVVPATLTPTPTYSASPTPTTTASSGGFISNLITDSYAVFSEPAVPKPAYLVPFVDPTFNTRIIRIAGDAGTSFTALNGTGTWGSVVTQHYTDDEPWNSDGTLLELQNLGTGASTDQVYLDGTTYQPKYVKCANYDNYDDRWNPNPNHPHERINVESDHAVLEWFDITTCTRTRVWNLPFVAADDLENGPSPDGRFIILHSGNQAFVVDMDPQPPYAPYPNQRIGPVATIDCGTLSTCTVNAVEISPSGRYALVHYQGDYNRVYDVDPTTLALTPHAEPLNAPECGGKDPQQGWIFDLGHPGLALNPFANNEDVLIGQRRSACTSLSGTTLGHVVMARLSDGQVTSLTDPTNEAYSYHISTQDWARSGWAYVSYYPSSGQRFNDEIIAVSMDGKQSVQRFVHDHSDTTNCYRCESHPVPSRDGTRFVFASSWSLGCTTGCGSQANPQAYILDARP